MGGILDAILMLTSFIAVLGVVIVVHELGHFQVARWCGIAIDTFSIGFGKTIWSRKDKSGVTWRLANLPLGGYVKFAGDADGTSVAPAEQISDPEEWKRAREKGLFHAQPVWKRAATTAAGPLANFVFAIVVIALMVQIFGRPVAIVGEIAPGSPAEAAGFQTGDRIVTADGQRIFGYDDLIMKVGPSAGQTISFEVVRDGARTALTATVAAVTVNDVTRGQLGVSSAGVAQRQTVSPVGAIEYGVRRTVQIIGLTLDYLGKVVTGKDAGRDISGPVGIFAVTGEQAKAAVSVEGDAFTKFVTLLVSLSQLAAFLSIAVGFANLLPVPILDGGHLVYYAIETVRGRPLSAKVQEYGAQAGLVALVSLFLFATWNDLQRLKVLEFLGGMLS
jgi:regulator of sigma E protease